jgi:hypothetical protein
MDLVAELPLALRLSLGADYDLAMGWWGNAAAVLGFAPGDWLVAELGVRRYRPYFELWTIWPAFTPVPYNSVFGNASLTLGKFFTVRAHGEQYRYEPTGAAAPLLVETLDRGWRWSLGAGYQGPRLAASANYFLELGPGAGAGGIEGTVRYRPSTELTLSLYGSYLRRPLELRFNDSELRVGEVQVEYRVSDRLILGVEVGRYGENRVRPDSAALTWDQFRIATRASILLRAARDRRGLPAAVLRMPRGSAGR